jgi:coiled-coil domain-containing protein 61
VEEKYTGNIWKGEFNGKYVEDITQKTGNFKKFGVFVKMMQAALKQDNDSVYLDILTPHDLELLKSRKTGTGLSNASQSSMALKTKEKRYLILTFKGEFEKVHYPLPLTFDELPATETMKSTISRLAKELEQIKSRTVISESGMGTPKSIKSAKNGFTVPNDLSEENEMLKRRLALLECRRVGGAVEMDYLTREIIEKESDYEKNLKNTDKELATLRHRLNQTEREAEETKKQLFNTKIELGHFNKTKDYEEIETLRSELGELSSSLQLERQESRAKIENNKKLLNSTIQDINKHVENEKKLKQRMTQLEKELEQVNKRPSYTPIRYNRASPGYNRTPNRYYSPTTNNAKRGNSVPTNKYTNNSKRTTPVRNNSYTRPQPPKNPFRPRYSPVPANKLNTSDRTKNTTVKRNYSPSNRLYSPSGAPRTNNRANNTRTMGAVDRVSPLRNLANQRPKVPPAASIYKGTNRTSNSPATRGNVFERLSGGSRQVNKAPTKAPVVHL